MIKVGALILMALTGSSSFATVVDDVLSRHARFALKCGEVLHVAAEWSKPRVAVATERARAAAEHARAAADYAYGVLREGTFEDRVSQNQIAILASQPKLEDEDREELNAVSLLLNKALAALEPEVAHEYRIIFRGTDLLLFTGHDVKLSFYPKRTPILVHKVNPVVEGRVHHDLLKRLHEYSVEHVPRRE